MLLHLDCFSRKKSFIESLDIAEFRSHKELCILVDTELNFHGHIRYIVEKSSGMSVNSLNSTLDHSREFILTLYISTIRPSLEFGSFVWNLECISDMKLLENVHRRWTKRIDGFENLTYSQ